MVFEEISAIESTFCGFKFPRDEERIMTSFFGTDRTQNFDVLVIGGGVIGCSIAYHLAKRQLSVCIIERLSLAAQQSSRAWGFIRQQGRHSAEIPLAAEASRLWASLEQELQADLEFVRSGILVTAETAEDEERLSTALETARLNGVNSELVGANEIGKLVPSAERKWRFGLYTPEDGHAEPIKTTLAFAEAAKRLGVCIHEGVSALGIEISDNKVIGVSTDRGAYRAQAVVCAAGVGSSEFLRSMDISAPIQPVRAPVAHTYSAGVISSVPVWSPHVSFRPKRDGSFYVANGYRGTDAEYDLGLHSFSDLFSFLPTFMANWRVIDLRLGRETLNVLRHQLTTGSLAIPTNDPVVNTKLVRENLEQFYQVFPRLRNLGLQRTWAGRIDATPDLIPIIDQVKYRNFYLAAGFNGHGFALAPIVGKLMSELAIDGRSSLDLNSFRLSRFSEGSLDRQRGAM
jgi:glycine/D-amino acid oxidase-like deaminating enzyme